ncbi:MAG TPA: hypothetical protein VNS58_31045 [Puia sp.]|nr:hypothetical protein [Puia sp.]
MKSSTLFFLLVSFLGCANPRIKFKTGLEGEMLPSVDLILADSITHFNTSAIPIGQNIVLLCYSPYCPYCRAEVDDILSNIETLQKTTFYLITPYPITDMKNFYNHYHLERYSNIIAGRDYKNELLPYFKASGVPYIAIYDTQKRLKEVLVGKSDAHIIKDILLE